MKKQHLILGAIIVGILALFILRPKKKEVVIKTREEIIKVEKEKKLQEDLKAAKKELEETIKRNKVIIKERAEKEKVEEKSLEEEKNEIISEVDITERSKKLDSLLQKIDNHKHSRRFSIPALVELKETLSENEIKKINERLYKLYKSTDQFDKAEEIIKELNGGGNIVGEENDEEL